MNRRKLLLIDAARRSLSDRVFEPLRQAGVEFASAPHEAGAALVLAGSPAGEHLSRLLAAHDARLPVAAAVVDDAGADLIHRLGLADVFDFRPPDSSPAGRLWAWLERAGVLGPTAPHPHLPLVPPKVFISHRFHDREFAVRLATALKIEGWEPWHYTGSERDYQAPGVEEEIDRQIKASVGLLVVLTEAWLASKWCKGEDKLARRLVPEKPTLYLQLTPTTPEYMMHRLAIDVSGGESGWLPRLMGAMRPWKADRPKRG